MAFFFSSSTLAEVTADPTQVAAAYQSYAASFKTSLGTAFSNLPEDYLKLSFCGVLAYELKPYGGSTALELEDILAETVIDCDNYAMLAWQLYELLSPTGGAHVAMVGWNGAPVVNHAQLVIQAAGYEALLVDPTVAHLALADSFNAVIAGVPIPAEKQASFYSRGDLDFFNGQVVGSLTQGLNGFKNLLYWFESPDAYIQHGASSATWPTPQSEVVGVSSPGYSGPNATAGADPGVTAVGLGQGFFSSAELNGVLDLPSSMADLYSSRGAAFATALSALQPTLSEDALKLLFAVQLAHELKSFDINATALAFDDTLNADALSGDGLAMLAYYLYEHTAPSPAVDVDLVFWKGSGLPAGPVLIVTLAGGQTVLADPTSALFAQVGTLDDLTRGVGLAASSMLTLGARPEAAALAATLGAALSDGIFRTGNLLAYFDDPEKYLVYGIGESRTPTPAADLLNETSPDSGIDVLLSSMPGHGPTMPTIVYTGSGGPDGIVGTAAGEILQGLGGDDILNGGPGADLLEGGSGNDTYYIDTINDAVVDTAGVDLVWSGVSWVLPAGIENLSLLGTSGAIDGVGNAGANVLTGNWASNRLWGGAGNDILDGGTGTDRALGGLGDDIFVVDNVGDTIVEYAGEGSDTVRTSLSDFVLPANVENIELLGTANLNATGSVGANTITGNSGTNTLNGGLGNDVLIGMGGKDLLTGSGGLDRMVLTSLSDSGVAFAARDVINTYAHGDKIDVSAIDAKTTVAGDQAFVFVSAFTGVAGQLQWDLTNVSVTGVKGYLVQGDVNGDSNADFSLQIYTAPTQSLPGGPDAWNLASWDFIL